MLSSDSDNINVGASMPSVYHTLAFVSVRATLAFR